jgi:hypothetical protein
MAASYGQSPISCTEINDEIEEIDVPITKGSVLTGMIRQLLAAVMLRTPMNREAAAGGQR